MKLNAIHQYVKENFKEFYTANSFKDRWIAQVNQTINARLGILNRHFRILIREHQVVDVPAQAKAKHAISRSDHAMFREYGEFKENPAKFEKLDAEIDRMIAGPQGEL